MIERAVTWWDGLSLRERWMVGVMLALLAVVILWLGIARPVERGLVSAQEAHEIALDRNAAIRAKVASLEKLPRRVGAGLTTPIPQLLTDSASEAGLTLDRAEDQGGGSVDIALASVKPQALFSWIAQLETQGVLVESLTAQPSATAGALSVQAVIKGPGQ
jgi:general secretion pathway protein M